MRETTRKRTNAKNAAASANCPQSRTASNTFLPFVSRLARRSPDPPRAPADSSQCAIAASCAHPPPSNRRVIRKSRHTSCFARLQFVTLNRLGIARVCLPCMARIQIQPGQSISRRLWLPVRPRSDSAPGSLLRTSISPPGESSAVRTAVWLFCAENITAFLSGLRKTWICRGNRGLEVFVYSIHAVSQRAATCGQA